MKLPEQIPTGTGQNAAPCCLLAPPRFSGAGPGAVPERCRCPMALRGWRPAAAALAAGRPRGGDPGGASAPGTGPGPEPGAPGGAVTAALYVHVRDRGGPGNGGGTREQGKGTWEQGGRTGRFARGDHGGHTWEAGGAHRGPWGCAQGRFGELHVGSGGCTLGGASRFTWRLARLRGGCSWDLGGAHGGGLQVGPGGLAHGGFCAVHLTGAPTACVP